jgi:hypothetical protein
MEGERVRVRETIWEWKTASYDPERSGQMDQPHPRRQAQGCRQLTVVVALLRLEEVLKLAEDVVDAAPEQMRAR